MVVEFQKLHSNYLQSGYSAGMKSGRRINKPYPLEKSGNVSFSATDKCIVSNTNNNLKRTILTSASNGSLSFKGGLKPESVDKIYKYMKHLVNPRTSKSAAKAERALRLLAYKAKKKHPYLTKFLSNKVFQKAMTTMNNNQLLSDAGIALFYTCFLRPLSIASLPTKDKNEKEKNHYQIGHSISTGIIGFATAFILQTPIKHAIDKVTTAVASKNASKYISKGAEDLFKKENIEKIRMLMERTHQPITLPLKAALTIYLVPKILKVFGLSKKGKSNNQKPEEVKYDSFKFLTSFKQNGMAFPNTKLEVKNANK